MSAGRKSSAWPGRLREAVFETLSRPPEALGRPDIPGLLVVLVSLAVGILASWQRWGNPLVDAGREMNVPLRLSRGEMLYSGVGYIYGPLSPYLNALLYRVFHPSLWVLWVRGMVTTLAVLGLAYWLGRQILGRFPAALAVLAVTWVCALKSQGNYLLPYAYPGLDGLVLVLATTAGLVLSVRRGFGWLALAGTFAGLAALAKTEMGASALLTGVAGSALAGYPRVRSMLARQFLFLLPALGLPVAVFSWFAREVGWHTLVVESHLFFGHVPRQLLYFNGLRFGFGHPWHSLGLMAASLVQLIAFLGLLAAVAGLLGSERRLGAVLAVLALSLFGIAATAVLLGDLGPFLSMPFLLVAVGAAGLAAFLRAPTPEGRMQAAVFLILVVGALASLARMILRVSTGGALSSFLLPGSILLFVYLWLEIFPLFLPDAVARLRARQLAAVALSLAVLATAVTLSVRYRRKFTYPLVTARGTWRTSPELGTAFDQARTFLEAWTAPGDAVAVVPEGTSLLFLTDRRNPLRDEILTPGFLDREGEERATRDLRDSRTAVVLVANRVTAEFGEPAFGADYDRALMSWIERNYAVCGTFGTRPDPKLPFGSPVFFIRGYCRLPGSSLSALQRSGRHVY